MLDQHGCSIDPNTYYAFKKRQKNPAPRTIRDRELIQAIHRIYTDNYSVYGARKMWNELQREGFTVARCTVERLMKAEDLSGVVRGKKIRTTVPNPEHERAPDRVKRAFVATTPNRIWVADFTYVAAWSGTVYVSFVVDTFSRRIVGWSAKTTKNTDLVLSALEMGLWHRDHTGHPVKTKELIHHSDAGSQYTSLRLTAHLAKEKIDASIGTVGDAYDNALMESTIGLYKTELIKRRGPWRTMSDIEYATMEWIDWYNHHRLHSQLGYIPPAEYEACYYESSLHHPVEATT